MAEEISFGVEVNTAAFEGAMQRLRAGVRKGLIDPQYGTLTVQARLLSERCQDFTPPRNVGQGSVAVIRDLSRIYFPVSASTFKDKRIQKIVRTDNREAWNSATANFPSSSPLRNTKAIGFSPDRHAQYRDKRGRAQRGKYGNLGSVTLGPQAKAARDYIKTVKARVGWARAGWNIGIIAFGGTVASEWVRRHSVNRGRVVDERASADPWVQVINDTGWAKYNGSEGERIVRNAVNARIRDMYKYAELQMELAAKNATGSMPISLAA